MKKQTAKNLPAAPYEPTPDEQAAVARYEKRKKALPVLPQMECKLTQTGEKSFDAKIRMDHSHQPTAYKMIADALNSGSMPFVYGWLKEASGLGILKSGTMNMDQVNYAIAVATGIKPRDHDRGDACFADGCGSHGVDERSSNALGVLNCQRLRYIREQPEQAWTHLHDTDGSL